MHAISRLWFRLLSLRLAAAGGVADVTWEPSLQGHGCITFSPKPETTGPLRALVVGRELSALHLTRVPSSQLRTDSLPWLWGSRRPTPEIKESRRPSTRIRCPLARRDGRGPNRRRCQDAAQPRAAVLGPGDLCVRRKTCPTVGGGGGAV